MISKLYVKAKTLLFLAKSSASVVFLANISKSTTDGLIIRGASYSEIKNVEKIYKELNSTSFSNYQKIQYKLHSKKTIIIAEKNSDGLKKVVGIDLYYLNPRDLKDGTIHEGFIGVLPEFEGQGIATKMRMIAKKHFQNQGFDGISTRISKLNLGSLISAKKLGFKPVEEYYDKLMDEDRYYLVCKLKE